MLLAATAAAGLLLAGCGGQETGEQAAQPTAEPTSNEQIRPGISAEDCDDPDAALTQAEWTEFCAGDPAEPTATEPTEGPVSGGPHEWPDGLAAEVVSVTTQSRAEYDNPTNDTYAQVTIRFTNTGEEPFTGWSGDATAIPEATLLFGVNRYEASQYGCEESGPGDLPRQLVPGTSADYVMCAYLPAAELGTLVLEVVPVWNGPYDPFTFTGVETLVGG